MPDREGDCPFCEGHESETPPETYALGPPGRLPDTSGWRVRVVPNLFPALEGAAGRHEVVVHSPRHVLSLAELSAAELDGVVDAWTARASAAREEGFPSVHLLVNEGRAAGGSRSHSHSQLVWLPQEPPAVVAERRIGSCRLCALLQHEREVQVRVVLEERGVVVLAAYAGRAPYELLVAPLACEGDGFASSAFPIAVHALADALRRLRRLAPNAPLNVWLHTFTGGENHWHFEVLPRLTVFAGLELGAGIYVNPLAPETAAEQLRIGRVEPVESTGGA